MTKPKPKTDPAIAPQTGVRGGYQPAGGGKKPAAPTTGSGVKAPPARHVVVHNPNAQAAAKMQRQQPFADPTGMLSIIEKVATNPEVDVDKVKEIVGLQERLLASQSRATFDAKFAEMAPHLPVIDERGLIVVRAKDNKGERTGEIQQSTSHAKLADIVEVVTPILGEYGFSLRFRNGLDEQGRVKVTGILAGHGHRETSEFVLPHDSTGSKNAVQAIGSSTTYGKRYLVTSMLNIVTRKPDDDDGFASGKPMVVGEACSAEEVEQLIELARAAECPGPRLITHLSKTRPAGHPELEALSDLPKSRFDEAVAAIRGFEANKKAAKSKEPAGA